MMQWMKQMVVIGYRITLQHLSYDKMDYEHQIETELDD